MTFIDSPSLAEKVKQILIEQLGVDDSEVTLAAHLVDELCVDSLDVIELMMAFEEAFDIEIPDEDVENLRPRTVQSVVDYIEKALKGKRA